MIIGIPKESLTGETRVAILPAEVKKLSSDFFKFNIESGAGNGSFIADAIYKESGAEIVSDVYFSVFLTLETTFIKLKMVCDRILKSDKSRKSSKT